MKLTSREKFIYIYLDLAQLRKFHLRNPSTLVRSSKMHKNTGAGCTKAG